MGAGYMDYDYALHMEPEGGIGSPREFTDELFAWASREHRDLVILEESMEPQVELDGKTYVCRLGDPDLGRFRLMKPLLKTGYTHSVGPHLGYQWVYFYEK